VTPTPSITNVAVVGTGVIGRSWIQVFARAGCRTRVFDQDAAQLDRARAWLVEDLDLAVADGFTTAGEAKALAARVTWHRAPGDAVSDAGWVQESGPEQLDRKQSIYAALDPVAPPETILGSSTSTLDMTEIARGLAGAGRCIVAHPVNPPHIVPAVEILGGAQTAPRVVERTIEFMRSLGQTPVVLKKYVFGFALNRMQAALVREAVSLVESGVADVDAVDACIRDGLGLRWALMGPFGVGHTNADGGIREYYHKYGSAYVGLCQALGGPVPDWNPGMVDRIATGTEAMAGPPSKVPKILKWRDRLVRRIRALKTQDPHP